MSQVNIEDFLNKHLVKVFYGIVVYFLLQISSDFKDMKTSIQQLVVSHAIIENRMSTLEENDKKQDALIDKNSEARIKYLDGKENYKR